MKGDLCSRELVDTYYRTTPPGEASGKTGRAMTQWQDSQA